MIRWPRNLEGIPAFGFTWKSRLCYWPSGGLDLLHAPAPPLDEDPEEIDDRLSTEPLTADGEPLH